jgi:hypothetical protein
MKVAIPTRFLRATEPEGRTNSEANVHAPTESQTTRAVPYVLQDETLGTFVLIDTPGLADTGGIHKDDENVGIILDVANRCPSLSAIILVANGTNAKFGINVRTTMSRLNGNIPDVALQNIVYILTNVALSNVSNFVVARAPFAPKYVCYMNNSAFSSDPTTWGKMSKMQNLINWMGSMHVVEKLFEGIAKMGQVSTSAFAQMREQRDVVKQALHEGRLKVEELQKVQNDILDIEAQMRRHKDDQNRFKDYTRQRTETRVTMNPTPYHNTLCSTCNTVCHKECGLEEIQVTGDCRFKNCTAFGGGGHCTVCGGERRCDHSSHYHARAIPSVSTETLDEILQDIKADYDKATDGIHAAEIDLNKLGDTKKLIESSIAALTQDILLSCNAIKSICKGFNFAEEMVILVDQLEAHRTTLTDPHARQASQSFIDAINGIIQSLHEDQRSAVAPVISK